MHEPLLNTSSCCSSFLLSWCVCACAHEQVILYDALDLKVLNKVVACRSRVVAVSFSRDGKLLATASEQGTVIRIFTVPSAVKVRRSPARFMSKWL